MFNDLNNANNAGHVAVDDIFAETDKRPQVQSPGDIETHHVGLAANGENLASLGAAEAVAIPGNKSKYLRIIIIIVIVLSLLGAAYFAYSQFFANSEAPIVKEPIKVEVEKPVAPKNEENNFVQVIPSATTSEPIEELVATSSSEMSTTSELEEIVTPEPVEEMSVDSDSDGLSDTEEKAAGTNINLIDTDNDSLSDYEEIKIYLTDPLLIDTDGDTYSDGAEIKSGYDPKVKGAKLPGNNN